MKGKIKSIS